jgi:dolichol kinase
MGEIIRKASHILFGLMVAYIAFRYGQNAFYASQITVILAVLAYNWAGVHAGSSRFRGLFRAINGVLERDDIAMAGEAAVLFSASIMLAYWVFGKESAIAASIVWAIGDGVCSLVGMALHRKGKSLEGMAAFIVFSFIGLALLYPHKALGMAIVVAGSAIMEYFSGNVNDNITVPLAAGLLSSVFL